MDVVLVYFKSDGERKDFPLRKGKSTVGRQEDCDYRIPLNQVSRLHCEFVLDDDGLTVRDLKSSNGTYVNNKRIAETKLKPGDAVIIGPVVFVVQIDGNPASPKPPSFEPVARKRPRSSEELVEDILMDDDEEDDETTRSALFDDEDDLDAGESDMALRVGDADDDPLGDALEALAGGSDDHSDPLDDLSEDDKKKKKKKK
jgi:pSer/pThr/pTyr-binding forkhead associated (FHA) protein